jgi:hypothetical protein
MILVYIILIIMLLHICLFLFQIIMMWYLKNKYKLKNYVPCKSFHRLNLNKTVSKTYNISLLNKMVFLLQTFIII